MNGKKIIFDAIWAINIIIIMMIIRFHVLLEYLSEMDFRGVLTINVLMFIHMRIIIALVMFILLRLVHFCFELGISEIIYKNKIISPPIYVMMRRMVVQ